MSALDPVNWCRDTTETVAFVSERERRRISQSKLDRAPHDAGQSTRKERALRIYASSMSMSVADDNYAVATKL